MLEKKTNSILLLLWKQFPLFTQGHGDFLVVRHTLRTRPKEILDRIFLGWEQILLGYKSDRISVRSSPVLLSPTSLFLTVLWMLIGFCYSWDFFFLRTSLGSHVKSQWNASSQFSSPNVVVPTKPGFWNPVVSRRNSQMTVWESSWRNRQVLSLRSLLVACTSVHQHPHRWRAKSCWLLQKFECAAKVTWSYEVGLSVFAIRYSCN